MAEADAQTLLLMGKLSQDMEEGIRQRSRQFRMLEQLSHQLTELQANFNSHVEHEDEAREAVLSQLRELTEAHSAMAERVAVVEVKASTDACDTEKPNAGTNGTRLVGGLGGVGLLTILFGDDIAGGLRKVADFIRKVLN